MTTITADEVREAEQAFSEAKAAARSTLPRAASREAVASVKAGYQPHADALARFRASFRRQEERDGRRCPIVNGRPLLAGGDATREGGFGPRSVTVSGLFFPTWRDIAKNVIAVDLDLETGKVALFTNSITPNFSTDTAYAVSPYNANEANGTGYTAGGQLLTSTTVTESPTGTLMWDAADPSWAGSTITARCMLAHADYLSPKAALVLVNFGADYATVAGTFLVTLASGGLATIDLTPP